MTNLIDECVNMISKSKNPVKEALALINKYGVNFVSLVLNRSIVMANVDVANQIYKAIMLNKVYMVNSFIKAANDGSFPLVLDNMNLDNKIGLAFDFLFSGSVSSFNEDGMRALELLKDDIDENIKAKRVN